MMTDSNRSLDELPALIAERKKFESWISALEGRRDATAPHVFDRVRTDYQARLREVEDRLAAHRSAILDERTNLESRRSLLEAEEQMRRDERAELELRAHVGELIGEDSESAFSTVDEALAKMGEEREGLSKRIDELDGFLTLPAREEPSVAEAPSPAAERAPTPAASPAVAAPGTPASGIAAGAAPGSPNPTSATPVDIKKLVLSEHSATFQRTSGQMPDIDEVLTEPPGTDRQIHGAGQQPTKGARLTPGGRFDELAFLSDVVGLKADANAGAAPASPPAAPPVPPAAASTNQTTQSATPLQGEPPKSPLEGIAGGRPAMLTPPLASNVGNTPIVLRAAGAIAQTKTLKCTECGAMNYPTEWYCERCGAELAAL
jgi:hypothetical protein